MQNQCFKFFDQLPMRQVGGEILQSFPDKEISIPNELLSNGTYRHRFPPTSTNMDWRAAEGKHGPQNIPHHVHMSVSVSVSSVWPCQTLPYLPSLFVVS